MQALQELWVQSLGREDSLEEEMATHSSIGFSLMVDVHLIYDVCVYTHVCIINNILV